MIAHSFNANGGVGGSASGSSLLFIAQSVYGGSDVFLRVNAIAVKQCCMGMFDLESQHTICFIGVRRC